MIVGEEVRLKLCVLIFLMFGVLNQDLGAVLIANNVEVHLSIEDFSMKSGVVTDVKFDCEKVDLTEKTFMHPVLTKTYQLSPGKYEIEWKTEKKETPWGDKKIDKFKKLIEFEVTDAVVYIKIRGENLTIY